MYRKMFNIPGYKTHVIKNACAEVGPKQLVDPENIKICYTSTPWRGLDILLGAWEMNPPENCELHVFSSCQIYGPEFGENDSMYEDLYRKCEELPGVVYRGSVPNQKLREELPSFDILAYPNTFEETSCIAVIEALSTGLRVITSSLGALPETTEGYARIYPFLMDKEIHSAEFSRILIEEIENVRYRFDPAPQMDFYKPRWSWESRVYEWNLLLEKILKK
jgi:glycosyltransferase involved in cell wall biosynthesis